MFKCFLTLLSSEQKQWAGPEDRETAWLQFKINNLQNDGLAALVCSPEDD